MEIGSVLSGRYRIDELVGEGGMSTVYRAYDSVLAREVAIKVLRDQFSSHALSKQRFKKEALSVAKLSHPNIVSVFDAGSDGVDNYIVMEFVSGTSLDREIKSYRGPMPVGRSLRIIDQVLDGLWHAHSHGVVHRDIKPHNILISEDGRVKIADFGIARATSEAELTQTGMVVGTVNYTSPEQAKGETATDRSDLYSAGVILYQMLTGSLPFTGEGEVAVAINHISERPAAPRKLNPAISPMLERVIFKAMEKDQGKRYSGAEEFKAAIMRVEDAYRESGLMDGPLDAKRCQTKPFMKVEGGSLQMSDAKGAGYDPKKGLKKLVLLIGVFILVAAAAAFGIYQAWSSWMQVDEVQVPDVSGLSFADARALLEERSLIAEVANSLYDKKIPVDGVISQDPGAGTKRKVNSQIKLVISLGPDLGLIPDLTGKDIREAGIIAEAAGFVIGENKTEFSMTMEKGRIIKQDPISGSQRDKGDTIIVFISDGLPPTVVVPDVKGMPLAEAAQLLKASGLMLGMTIETPSTAYPEGTVIDQTPPSGSEVDLNSEVDLKVSMKAAVSSGPDSKRFEVTYSVPQETWIQEVIIKVADTYGTRTVFGPSSFKSGQQVRETVEVFGSGRIEVWVDGILYKAYDV